MRNISDILPNWEDIRRLENEIPHHTLKNKKEEVEYDK